ncbi:DUF2339 domain-containing protein [Fibrella sp. HMF5335]|uniref:DUF2339 domain-containing protein n=1 Tax=Fibrella rubiginis TaxID=2817060 RepID=A0A939GGS0_9BACT|nr:DUF2339 domain-containing protein [Fibrella rubiginis]MBO0936510.1 DUF2339 domain-containing protein [Fibrella rubiginis]
MESLYILILIGLFLFINQKFVALKALFEQQHNDLLQLRNHLLGNVPVSATTPPVVLPTPPATPYASEYEPPKPAVTPPVPAAVPPPVIPAPPVPAADLEPVLSIAAPETPVAPKKNLLDPSLLNPPVAPPVEAGPGWFARFLAENPDMEKFIGENLINKIGIAILVAGIGYFVRFAIAQEWVGEIGRVLIGVLAGGALLAVAHRLRDRFAAFSSVLVAGGLSVLYFTIAIAFSDYKILGQTTTFAIMVVITGFAVTLSIAYNRVELAVMSLIGGFATPFMVSSGQGNYVVLLTYILILDVGMLVLSAFKKWPLVHWVAYVATVLLFGAWLSAEVLSPVPNPPYVGALVFASLFYAVFVVRNLFDRLRSESTFTAVDISLFLSNTALYYTAGMAVLAHIDKGAYQGLFTIALGAINFGYAALLFRRSADTTLLYLLIGLVITFVSLTIPVQLEGNYITMFWALEAVLLLWLSQRSGLRLPATASVIVLVLMAISLLMDWTTLYGDSATVLPILVNKAFITGLLAVAGLAGTYYLLGKQEKPMSFWVGELAITPYRTFIGYASLATVYLVGLLELRYQLVAAYGLGPNTLLILGTYNLLVALAVLAVVQRFATLPRLGAAAVLGVLAVGYYMFSLAPVVPDLLYAYFTGTEPTRVGFPFQYVNLLAVAGILYFLFRTKPQLTPTAPALETAWPWFLVFTVVFSLSWVLCANVLAVHFAGSDVVHTPTQQAVFTDDYNALIRQIIKVGLPILWGVCAFAFMYVGLVRRNRTYRVLSLGLFALTLAKLFFYDIRGISEGGRIIAFISLGAILLIISFMYQRIKKLVM